MKITILDYKTLERPSLPEKLKEYGEVTVYNTTKPEEVRSRITDTEILVINKVWIGKDELEETPVKLICILATGVNNIDLDYCKDKGIAVYNVAGYSTPCVAQTTFASVLYLLQNLSYYDNYVKSGEYCKSEIFTHVDKPYFEIKCKKWGIIGLGTIGREVAKIASAFGAEIIYYSTSGKNSTNDYNRVELNELLNNSDIISIHAPLNDKTNNLITKNELKQMKNTSILVNMGRGGIVNESDLAEAIDNNTIMAAATDVLTKEPVNTDNPLLKVKNSDNLLITPHLAWASNEAKDRIAEEVYLNVKRFKSGDNYNKVV